MQTQFVTQPSPASVRAWEDQVQAAADVLGLIPILNIPAEIVSGIISLRKKDYVGFGLSVAGLVPLQGEAAVALKIARTSQQIVKQNKEYKISQANYKISQASREVPQAV